MDNVKFTILIPTRNRAETLKYCLMTCINQNYDNYEIIVSDNCSSDNTREVIESLNCNKIKYYKTKELLPMTKNYQFALEKVKGEYVICLGDDDGLHFHALELLNKVIKLVKAPVIHWDLNYYSWPNYLLNNLANYLQLKKIKKSEFFCGEEKIKKVLNFEERYDVLPMLYMNSAIKVDFIRGIEKKNVKVFDSCAPDVYSGLVIAYYAKYFFYLGFPVSIAGSSKKSNGMGSITLIEGNSVTKEFSMLNEKFGIRYYSSFDKIRFSETLAVEDSMNHALSNFLPRNNKFNIDYKALISRLVEDVRHCCGYYSEDGEKIFKETLTYVYDVIKSKFDDDIKVFFENEILKKLKPIEYYDFNEKFFPDFNDKYLVIDAKNFEATNIFEIAKLSENILGYKLRVDEYEKKLKKVIKAVNKICTNNNIGIYGANTHGKVVLKLIEYICDIKDYNIYFFDSDKNKWGTKIEEYTINNPELIKKMNIDKVVICSYTYQEEIYKTLKELIDDSKIMKLYTSDEEFYFDILV
ncbi:glycosyltransferase family 2 protein [Clostridium felsineum]|uniref:glycosyltransferase family 2 protein n=1 Tax=Clostridium felsineum TaxID=36839 RepID=UPI00098C6B25|nr:glycosyltransferase family 2 protein [Clostridium felsineum]URZ16001.1 hypothetical protein CLFE_020480 [Clostridium felsineum DSM 794]